ncbi:MAG: hypothetical protein DDT40_01746 [candidate division WS2 bacterium]|nr:hypothetical protein [Candidatus Psychracetigena formicireducens]
MESQEKQEFIRLRMAMATDKVKAAKDLLLTGHKRDAVSASYYAMFYAAKAVLLAEGKDPHTHEGIKRLFGKYCIENGKLDKSFGKMFAVAQEARYRADYKEKVKITKKDAEEAIENAEIFINKMKKVLKGRWRSKKIVES